MGLVTKQYTFSAGGVIVAAEHNANFDDLYNEFNGSISNANISASAAIVDTKLASITTTAKVNVSALTVASQATGDILYASSATVFARLAVGTNGHFLVLASGIPSWTNNLPGATPIIFEGATANDFETSVSIVDPTADRTFTIGNEDCNLAQQVAKFWARIDGVTATAVLRDSHNCDSLTDNGTGDYTITITTDFANDTYACIATVHKNAGADSRTAIVDTLAVGTARVLADNGAGTLKDADLSVAGFGDR